MFSCFILSASPSFFFHLPFIDTKHQPLIPGNFFSSLLESDMERQILQKQQFQGSGAMTRINAY